MQCIITEKQPNQLTYCDETKNCQTTRSVRAKEKPQLWGGGGGGGQMCKVGGRFADFYLIFLKYPMKMK